MVRVAIAILVVALWIYAIIDCARTPHDKLPGRLAKPIWILVTLVPVLGSLLWLALAFPIKHPNFGGTVSLGKTVAPDDDPVFLAKLDARNRFRKWERNKQQEKSPAGDEEDGSGEDLDADLRRLLDEEGQNGGFEPEAGGPA